MSRIRVLKMNPGSRTNSLEQLARLMSMSSFINDSDSDDSDDYNNDSCSVLHLNQGIVAKPKQKGQRSPNAKRRKKSFHAEIGNISLTITTGLLAEQTADVIINSVSPDLDLAKGAGSHALLQVAGPEIQDECFQTYQTGIIPGNVAVTSGGNANCNSLYHVTLPKWNSNSEEIFVALQNCLSLADKNGVKSVVVPPLGHGYLGYPDDVIAKTMISTAKEIGDNCRQVSLTIVCHRRQNMVFKALQHEMKDLIVQMHMEMYKGEPRAPSYWTQYDKSRTLREWNCGQTSTKCWEFVDVSHEERAAVESLMMNTWKKNFVGHGKDASGLRNLQYTNINVLNVQRVENPMLAERYCQFRASMFRKVGQLGRTFPRLDDIPVAKSGPILTTSRAHRILTREMFPMVNEHYLFHGTSRDRIDVISAQGFDPRLTEMAMFGQGIYTAESSTKSDQYSDPRDRRDKRSEKKMILSRVLLGEMYVIQEQRTYSRPPCRTCRDDKCSDPSHNLNGHGFFDSVVVDGQWNFREFIVYNSNQCYPEYIITYKRV